MDGLKKHADMLTSYLGPETPGSTVNQVSLAAGPDFLVEIEAVATLHSPAAASADHKP